MKLIFVPLVLLLLVAAFYEHFMSAISSSENALNLILQIGPTSFVILIVLSIINWLLEGMKWNKLVKCLQEERFIDSFKAVLFGISLGIITPNRIGEYGGRILNLEPENKKKGLTLSIVSSMYQLMITLVIGLSALVILVHAYHLNVPINLDWNFESLLVLIIMMVILSAAIYAFPMTKRLKAYKWILSLKKTLMSSRQLSVSLATLSLARYLVFSTQYYILLTVLDVGLSSDLCYILIAITYLFNTISPGGMILNLSWRTTTSVFVFSLAGGNPLSVLIASLLIWVINLFIPGLIGIGLFKGLKSHSFSFK